MKFKEASLETHGCEEGNGAFMYPKSAKFHGKQGCPHTGLRCCLFCDEVYCPDRCEIIKLLPRQPMRIQEEFDCPRLVPVQDLAWKYLLGTNIPKVGR